MYLGCFLVYLWSKYFSLLSIMSDTLADSIHFLCSLPNSSLLILNNGFLKMFSVKKSWWRFHHKVKPCCWHIFVILWFYCGFINEWSAFLYWWNSSDHGSSQGGNRQVAKQGFLGFISPSWDLFFLAKGFLGKVVNLISLHNIFKIMFL